MRKSITTKLPECLVNVESPEDAAIRKLRAELAASRKREARMKQDAERYRWLCDVATEQQWVELGGYTVKKIIDGAIDALRGEVKP